MKYICFMKILLTDDACQHKNNFRNLGVGKVPLLANSWKVCSACNTLSTSLMMSFESRGRIDTICKISLSVPNAFSIAVARCGIPNEIFLVSCNCSSCLFKQSRYVLGRLGQKLTETENMINERQPDDRIVKSTHHPSIFSAN